MKPFMDADALMIYTDGSYCSRKRRQAYGWVLANSFGALTPARVVATDTHASFISASMLMESAAIVDALVEFAPRCKHMVIHADNQGLAHLLKQYTAGNTSSELFLDKPNIIAEDDAHRLMAILPDVSFEIVWVKGHSGNFYNMIADQMLRLAGLDGYTETQAIDFAEEALATGQAVVRGKIISGGNYHQGDILIHRNELTAAA